MRKLTLVLMFLATSAFATTSTTLQPTTTNNDDSCDISVQPAATLLLPYFEVDTTKPSSQAVTTLFTVQNVSNLPQIVNVTIWTDWGYPLFDFPIFLTGYDVQPINLYDLLARGVIAPGSSPSNSGTSNRTPVPTNPTQGSQPAGNSANPNFLASAAQNCAYTPGLIPQFVTTELTSILTHGTTTAHLTNCPAGTAIGGSHTNAIGYLTIDVVATCYAGFPASTDYFNTVLLYDNVLTGDYQQITPGKYALGGPLVHIRAVPEGGPAGSLPGTNLPYTFYDRMTTHAVYRTIDRRQPLPSQFAPRFIQAGSGNFNTSFKIWREPVTGADATCTDYSKNSSMPISDIVRFDEHENATIGTAVLFDPMVPPTLPATSMVSTSTFLFPPLSTSKDVAGWMYLNLNNGGSLAYGAAPGAGGIPRNFSNQNTTIRQSQNWVVTSMYADPSYASEGTALALSNGCSPAPLPGAQIGPAPNVNP